VPTSSAASSSCPGVLGQRVRSRADWVAQNFITDDTEKMSADALKDLAARTMALAARATRFDGVALPPDLARRMKLLKLASIPLPVPKDEKALDSDEVDQETVKVNKPAPAKRASAAKSTAKKSTAKKSTAVSSK